MGLSLLLLLATSALASGPEKDCPAYTTFTYRLDRAKASLERVAVSKAGDRICGELQVAGDENARLEIEQGGKVVFTRPVHVMTTVSYDALEGSGPDKRLAGGRVDNPAPLFTALLPIEPLRATPPPRLRVVDIATGKTLGSTR